MTALCRECSYLEMEDGYSYCRYCLTDQIDLGEMLLTDVIPRHRPEFEGWMKEVREHREQLLEKLTAPNMRVRQAD